MTVNEMKYTLFSFYPALLSSFAAPEKIIESLGFTKDIINLFCVI